MIPRHLSLPQEEQPVLTWRELEELRAKAAALDRAIEWLKGRRDSEKLIEVYDILTGR